MHGINKPTSANKRPSGIRRFVTDREGGAAVQFAILLPTLLILIVVLLELVFMSVVYLQIGEAARRGSRLATIVDPIANLEDLQEGAPIECRRNDGTITCTNASVVDANSFEEIYQDMVGILPTLERNNIRVVYRHGGIGDPDALNGVIPVITVRITSYEHRFALAALIPGAPAQITMPSVYVSLMGSGRAVSGS